MDFTGKRKAGCRSVSLTGAFMPSMRTQGARVYSWCPILQRRAAMDSELHQDSSFHCIQSQT